MCVLATHILGMGPVAEVVHPLVDMQFRGECFVLLWHFVLSLLCHCFLRLALSCTCLWLSGLVCVLSRHLTFVLRLPLRRTCGFQFAGELALVAAWLLPTLFLVDLAPIGPGIVFRWF